MLPMILPPLVGVPGFVFILGRAGTVNVILRDWFGGTRSTSLLEWLRRHDPRLDHELRIYLFTDKPIVEVAGAK